jgi:type II secretory pathway pseudopilin PulG
MTLLELVITLAIMAVLATIAVPSLQSATDNVALVRDEASLVTLTNVAQTVATERGSTIPSPSDFSQAITSSSYVPTSDPLITNPTSIIDDPAPGTGPMVASTVPGQVSVNPGTITINANGQSVPIGGAAMLTQEGDCIMVEFTPSKTVSFAFPYNPNEPIECSGAEALNGPGQTPPTVPSSPPGAPTHVTLTGSLPDLVANWTQIPDIYAYDLVLYTGSTQVMTTTLAPGDLTYTFAGLSASTYTVDVSGINAAGQGPPGVANWNDLPGAPTGVVATQVSGTTNVTITWTPPTDNGAPTSYTATAVQDPSKYCTITVGTTPANQCVVDGLTIGDTYTFTVTGTNAAGTGPPSAPSNPVTISSVPGPPAAPSATYTYGSTATINWSPPPDTGGSPITGYTVVSLPGGSGCTTSGATTCVVTGLVGGQSYTFAVDATNSYGTGPLSPYSTAINVTSAPGAPTNAAATAGDTTATVTWTAPASTGGTPITGYVVTGAPGGSCTTSGATTCVVGGLTDGTSYTFTVVAVNDSGSGGAPQDGPPSAPTNPVTPLGAPSAPTNVVAVASTSGSGSANITWTGSSSDGGSSITGYTATSSPGGFTCSTSGATDCTVTGLTLGTTYTFTVTGTNAGGFTSYSSLPSNAVTPYSTPYAPTNLTASLGDSQVTLNWDAPTNDGGSAITGYTVTATPGGESCDTTGATTCTVTGLTNGTTYTFSVVAINAGGSSAPATVNGQPYGTPSQMNAPTVAYTPGTTTATVSWVAPSSTGGVPLTSYTVIGSNDTGCTTTPPTTTCTITGLVGGQTYAFNVTATNTGADGGSNTSPLSPPSTSFVALTAPTAPGAVTATYTPGNSTAVISWNAPTNDGYGNSDGTDITGYSVTGSPGTSCSTAAASSPATSCTVTGLVGGTAYTFTVTATNTYGLVSPPGGPSSPIYVFTPPSAPLDPTASYVIPTTYATVSWSAPATTGGGVITGYTVTGSPGGTCSTSGDPASTSCVVTGLTPGTAYTFTITATSTITTGSSPTSLTGPPSVPTNSITPYVSPVWSGPVTETSSTSNTLTFGWPAVTSTGGGTVTFYYFGACSGSTTGLTATCTGLTPNTSYTLYVYAQNTGGVATGTYSGTGTTTGSSGTVDGQPSTPTVSSTGNTTSSITWAFSNTSMGVNATSEQFSYYDSDNYCSGTTALSTSQSGNITCTGMPPNTSDTFYVQAINNGGANSGLGSATSSSSGLSYGTPATPSVSAVGESSSSISWSFSNSSYGTNATAEQFSYYDTDGYCSGSTSLSSAQSGSVTCSGMPSATGDTLEVEAINNGGVASPYGSGSGSTTGTAYGSPSVPSVSAIAETSSSITWSFSNSSYGSSASSEYFYYYDTGGYCSGSTGLSTGLSGTVTCSSMPSGTSDTLEVEAINNGGVGSGFGSATASTSGSGGGSSGTAPATPSISGSAGTSSDTFSITDSNFGGASSLSYTWYDTSSNCNYGSNGSGQGCGQGTMTSTSGAGSSGLVDSGLQQGTSYTITATVSNSYGSATGTYSFTTQASPPGTPTITNHSISNSQATLDWSDTSGGPVTSLDGTVYGSTSSSAGCSTAVHSQAVPNSVDVISDSQIHFSSASGGAAASGSFDTTDDYYWAKLTSANGPGGSSGASTCVLINTPSGGGGGGGTTTTTTTTTPAPTGHTAVNAVSLRFVSEACNGTVTHNGGAYCPNSIINLSWSYSGPYPPYGTSRTLYIWSTCAPITCAGGGTYSANLSTDQTSGTPSTNIGNVEENSTWDAELVITNAYGSTVSNTVTFPFNPGS